MKKILFGLGAIGAVIAPVAAVVSCNDEDARFNETTIKSAAELKTFAAKFGYELTDAIAQSTFTEFGGTPAKPLTVKAYSHVKAEGKEKNIAIVIKGVQENKTEGANAEGITFLDSKWNFSKADLKEANRVVFLHTYTAAEKTTQNLHEDHSISWVKIQKDGQNIVALDVVTVAANRF